MFTKFCHRYHYFVVMFTILISHCVLKLATSRAISNTNVTLINNSLVKQYLYYDGRDVALQSTLTSADNFKLVDNGTSLHIEAHRNSSIKIRVNNDTLTTGSSGVAEVYTSGGTTAVKIYFEDTDGDRWYLRVNSDNDEAVEIVSESYVNNIESQNPQDPTKLKEIQFDLEDVPSFLLQ